MLNGIHCAMRENVEKAMEHLGRAAERQKRNHDERAEPRKFNIRDWVIRFYTPNLRNKLNPICISPYEVVAKPGALTYSLRQPGERKCITDHVDHVKKYWRPEDLMETESAEDSQCRPASDWPLWVQIWLTWWRGSCFTAATWWVWVMSEPTSKS